MTCILFGGTGEVGGAVARALIASDVCSRLTLLGRRAVPGLGDVPGVEQIVVDTAAADFERSVEDAARGHDAAISCIGIGAGTASIPEEQLMEIEYHVFGRYARGCKAAGVETFLLLSAVGIDETSVDSRIKYSRVAGWKYRAAVDAGFERLAVFQPGTIVGNKHTPRWVVPFIGLLPDSVGWGTIHQDDIARAFVAHLERAAEQRQPVVVYGNAEMKRLVAARRSGLRGGSGGLHGGGG